MKLTNDPALGRREKGPEAFGNLDPAPELTGDPDGDPVSRKADAGDFWVEAAVSDPAFSLKGLDFGSV